MTIPTKPVPEDSTLKALWDDALQHEAYEVEQWLEAHSPQPQASAEDTEPKAQRLPSRENGETSGLQESQKTYSEEVSQISEHLWLGRGLVTRQEYKDFMKKTARLEAVLNVAGVKPEWVNLRILYANFHFMDGWEPVPLAYLIPAVQFVRFCQEQHLNTLVHCAAGISRSSTLVICYLMSLGTPYEEALAQVLKARPSIDPNYHLLSETNILPFLDFFHQPHSIWNRTSRTL
ncbi:MAG: dual specificity protein phosphatase family protein [SAR324 cluster bacterium]|nr:dual specificity protein phosphatase family protein [SAR324 cluster bacterium]